MPPRLRAVPLFSDHARLCSLKSLSEEVASDGLGIVRTSSCMYGESPYANGVRGSMRRTAKTTRRSLKADRLEARVTPEQKQLIARAAALRGCSVTEFIVASAQEAAAETIKDFEILTLHDEARDVFVNAILHPPAPSESARKTAQRSIEEIGHRLAADAVKPRFVVEPLGPKHDRATFSSGVEALDTYLQKQAGQDLKKGAAVPFVITPDGKTIAGYYTLSQYAVHLDAVPAEVAKKLPKYPVVPATLLGRLAVGTAFGGQGLGSMLLMDALYRALQHSKEPASAGVVVDAKGSAALAFYKKYGFLELPQNRAATIYTDGNGGAVVSITGVGAVRRHREPEIRRMKTIRRLSGKRARSCEIVVSTLSDRELRTTEMRDLWLCSRRPF